MRVTLPLILNATIYESSRRALPKIWMLERGIHREIYWFGYFVVIVDTLFQSPSFEVVNLGGTIGCSLEPSIYRSVTGRKVMDGVVTIQESMLTHVC